ncbi:MAG: DUF885 domain-containing protein [Thermoanaerobaculia bacterium]
MKLALFGAAVFVASSAFASGSSVVAEVGKEYWNLVLEDRIDLREELGLPIESLPDVSDSRAKELAAKARVLLRRLEPVAPESLEPEERLSLLVLRKELSNWVEAPKYSDFALPVMPYTSPFSTIRRVLADYKFAGEADARRYLSLLDDLARLTVTVEAKLRSSAGRGIVIPRDEIELLLPSLEPLAERSGESPFRAAPSRLAAPGIDAAAFERQQAAKIDGKVAPAFGRLLTYLRGDYRKAAPSGVGLSQYPGGEAYYRYLVAYHTNSPLSPEEIHRYGLSEMERINRELDAVRQKVGFPGSLADFRRSLKTDVRFFPKTPEEIGDRLMAAVRRVEPKIPLFFSRIPKAPYGVRRLDPALEGSMTFGYYQVPTPGHPEGDYLFNGSRLSERSLLNAPALIAHELVPGHHFQINLQSENESLPIYRRHLIDVTAYVEGWGEYASALAGEMGLYDQPYDRCGRLAMEAFLSARLVVDTGMNLLGWPRERAIAYMRDNTFETDLQISTETLRYSCDMPGQALAYKMGSRKFFELREKARRELGPKFGIRRFHEAVLGSGALPMNVLETKVDEWIAAEKAAVQPRG